MIRLVKYKQGHQFYQVNIDTLIKTKLDFLNFTVKDNVPVYDILLENEIYQIKNSNQININNEMSVKSLSEKLGVKCIIILKDEFDHWKEMFDLLDFSEEKKIIQLHPYQNKYYEQLCKIISDNKVSCLSLPPRFGKTYLIGKFIQEHPEIKVCIITSYPSECFPVYERIQSEYNFNFKYQSKQYFREEDYEEKIKEFQDIDLFFLDEFHYCGNTELTQKVLKTLDKKLCYVSGTPFRLIKLQKLPYISISKEDFEKIDYPQLEINYIADNKIQNIHSLELKQQKMLVEGEVDVTDDLTFVYLETDGNCVEQKSYIEKCLRKNDITNVQIFCEQNKVGGTYEDLCNIFVMNNNMNELLIQQIFRLMTPSFYHTKSCFVYNFQQIINIIQFFQKLFSLDISILDFDKILPRQIRLNIDKELIKTYICQQTVKLTCVNEDNKKYIQKKLMEKINETILGTTNKIKKQDTKERMEKFVEKINNIQNEKIHPMILLMERVSTFIVIVSYFNDQKIYDETQQDYMLRGLYNQMSEQNKLKLKDILNGMFSEKLFDANYNYKIDFICRIFDAENKTQLIYNYYNQFEQLIKSQDKIILYEQFMQNMCSTTEHEKKQNAEILTPIWLVKEMIQKGSDLIPCLQQKQIKYPKIIEPCCGKGAFLVCLYDHLVQLGYNQKEILEEILVFNDINEFNIQICKLLLDPTNEYKLQYKTINALEINYGEYDLVITNPPYSSIKENKNNQSKNTQTVQIYQHFMTLGKCCFTLTPCKWKQQQQMQQFKKQIENNILLYKEVGTPFQNVQTGIISYQIVSKDKIKKENVLMEKVLENNLLQQFKRQDGEYFIHRSKKQWIGDQPTQDSVKVIVSIKKGQYRYIQKQYVKNQDDINKYKVILPNINKPGDYIKDIIILGQNEIFNCSSCGFICDDLEQAQKLQQYLLSNEVQTIIKNNLITTHLTNPILQMIPQLK